MFILRGFSFTICIIIVFVSQNAFSANRCEALFQSVNPLQTHFTQEMKLISDFENVKKNYFEAETRDQANDHMYTMVVLSNHIFDLAIQRIIEVNFFNQSDKIKNMKAAVVSNIIEMLQKTYQIDDENMALAIKTRVNREVEAINANHKAMTERRAIGFGRDESAIEFHREPESREPIGFLPPRQDVEPEEGGASQNRMGFDLTVNSDVENSIVDLVEYQKSDDDDIQIGFFNRGSEEEESFKPFAIGFVPLKPDMESPTSQNTDTIVFNTDLGEFGLLKR